ncbi:MAG: methyltransferase [Planctomycetota bacterium]
MAFSKGSTNKLNRRTAPRFEGETLFARVARAVCEAECLPRKELYESWECARRIRRLLRGGAVREIAGGHGLLSALLILLDDSSPTATVVDVRRPDSQSKVLESLTRQWPRLEGRVQFVEGSVDDERAQAEDLVVSVHACGSLTDRVIDLAASGRSRVAVLPCCHELDRSDTGQLRGWVNGPLAVDLVRAERLKRADYEIRTQRIPEEITPHNRLLIGWPREQ